MGLDMYLTKKIYIGGGYDHNHVSGTVSIQADGKIININPKEITEIVCDVGSWRKVNAIHQWFVDNVQDGIDKCEEHSVLYSDLITLKNLCLEVIETKNPSKLPPQSGFFFGSTDIDQYYYGGLMETIQIIEKLDPEGDYYYRSSW